MTGALAIASACTTDDVVVDPPDASDPRTLYPLEDDAFAEYLIFRDVPGVVTTEPGAATRYALDVDLVGGVTELALSKTNSAVMALSDAGVASAATKIVSLDGIQHFTNLQLLRITSNALTSLDVSALTQLTNLEMNFNAVGTLDLRQNSALILLRYQASSGAGEGGRLDRIDLSGNPALRHLSLPGHDLTAIDLRVNTSLDDTLDLADNPGPDGDRATPDIVVPAQIFNQVPAENRRGVTSDADAPVQLALSAGAAELPENGGSTMIMAVLNRTSTAAVTLRLTTGGTATLDVDYTLAPTMLSIAPGELMATAVLTTVDDPDMEGIETIEVRAVDVVNAGVGSVVVDVDIVDDDGAVSLVINEVLYDPPNDLPGDANGDGARDPNEDEFVELVNTSPSAVDLSGYQFFDNGAMTEGMPRHTVPAGTTLNPNQAYVLFGGGTPTGDFGGAVVQVCNGFENRLNLNNAGDVLTIQNAGGATLLTFDVEPLSNNPNESYTRAPDLTGEFEQHASVVDEVLYSPGTRADGTPF